MKLAKASMLAGLVLVVSLSGCFGGAKEAPKAAPPPPPELSKQDIQKFQELAAPEIRNYALPGSQKLDPKVKWFNGTFDTAANTGVQDRNDRGGNDFNVVLQKFSIDDMVPVGQPTALKIKLVYFGSPGSSVKGDIYVCVPGTCTYYTTNNDDQFNWKATVQTINVMTIGVSGKKSEVGVSEADGMMAQPLKFALEVTATYFQDVLTPYHAYAFQVPSGATGVTLRSVKPGQEHLQAKFVVIDPNDQLVAYNEYNDIAILTESIFIPTRQPGEYVFYAEQMHNGFFSMTSDAPLDNNQLRILDTKDEAVSTFAGGAPAVGTPDKDFTGTGTTLPYTPGTTQKFTVDKSFPLDVWATIKPGVVGLVEVKISSSKGLVYQLNRDLRVDQGEPGTSGGGSLGLTRDESNTVVHWANLAKGPYSVDIVADGSTSDIVSMVKTYKR